jgi:hypothetical protein
MGTVLKPAPSPSGWGLPLSCLSNLSTQNLSPPLTVSGTLVGSLTKALITVITGLKDSQWGQQPIILP